MALFTGRGQRMTGQELPLSVSETYFSILPVLRLKRDLSCTLYLKSLLVRGFWFNVKGATA